MYARTVSLPPSLVIHRRVRDREHLHVGYVLSHTYVLYQASDRVFG